MSYYIRKNGVTKRLAVIPQDYPAELIGYDNTSSGLTADEVQGAVDEVNSAKVSKSGDTMTGGLKIARSGNATQLVLERPNETSETVSSLIQLGNSTADGSVGSTFGIVRIYGDDTKYAHLQARNVSANRTIELPDESGTIALEEKVVSKSGDTMTGLLTINNRSEGQITANRQHTDTTSQPSTVIIGNNVADGTAGSTYGKLRLYGKNTYRTDLTAPDSTVNRVISFPNKDGTVLLNESLTQAAVPIKGGASYAYIPNFKDKFYKVRNPVLCWYTDQAGMAYVFIIFTGPNDDWNNLGITNILNAQALSASDLSFNGAELAIANLGNWGYGTAIGLSPNFVP